MGRRIFIGLVAALLLLAAACGNDDGGEAADPTTTTTEATTSTTAAGITTTTVAASQDPDAAFAVTYCEAWGEGARNADGVLALMSEDAVAVDMTAGVEYAGQDEIRTWIEDDPEFTTLELMTCGEEAVAARGWAAYGYATRSSTEPVGAEGVGVVHLDEDGNIDRFLVYSTEVEGEPSAPNVLSEADTAVVDEYRRSYADRDEEAFVAVVSDDFVRYIGPTGLSAPAFPGLEGYRTWAAETKGQNLTVDMGEVAVGDGPWIAHADVWFDADGDELIGGICLVEVVNGQANRHYLHYA